MAFLQLVDKIFTVLNNNEYVLGIILDLYKAFDHEIWLSKLHYGFHIIGYIFMFMIENNLFMQTAVHLPGPRYPVACHREG